MALIASGALFLSTTILEMLAGPPPSHGAEIIAWAESGKLALALASEFLFFATVSLVPGVVALYLSLATPHRIKAMLGCGIIAMTLPVLAVLDVVLGRLAFPVYGLHITAPAVAELVVALFVGGMHAVDILLAIATFVLSLAMRRGAYGPAVAYLGFATALCDVAAAYPYIIGPALTLVCRVFFAAWFVAVGSRLYRMRSGAEKTGP